MHLERIRRPKGELMMVGVGLGACVIGWEICACWDCQMPKILSEW